MREFFRRSSATSGSFVITLPVACCWRFCKRTSRSSMGSERCKRLFVGLEDRKKVKYM